MALREIIWGGITAVAVVLGPAPFWAAADTQSTAGVGALPPAAVMEQAAQRAMTPAQALQRLKEGNARFASGKLVERDWIGAVKKTASGQYPFATILGCIDSRVPPEIVFDQGIGDIFSVRIAGNFVDPEILGSLEFASKVAGSKLIVILGHSACGAIKGACDGVELGNLTTTLSHLRPAVEAVQDVPGPRNGKNAAFVDAVTHMNVRLTMESLRKQSPILDEMITKHEVGLVGGVYDVTTGVVTWLE
ncbi:MAG TPA: carbonic anhydrase [Deltaproteobacteria bacterium]|nr:carbonic anhydrase [Deltaproteobacteria bacterium]